MPVQTGGSLAERVGFEPTVGLLQRRFSRPVHSTALPPLRHLLNQPLALYCASLLSPVLRSMFPFCFHSAPSTAPKHRRHPAAPAVVSGGGIVIGLALLGHTVYEIRTGRHRGKWRSYCRACL